ncbi:hypothetical protein BN1002_04226 [Bacillus sp. B-jedd]|nr:hypothetical protein BN1002_04226 [Bacillus sp. B-jedd]
MSPEWKSTANDNRTKTQKNPDRPNVIPLSDAGTNPTWFVYIYYPIPSPLFLFSKSNILSTTKVVIAKTIFTCHNLVGNYVTLLSMVGKRLFFLLYYTKDIQFLAFSP